MALCYPRPDGTELRPGPEISGPVQAHLGKGSPVTGTRQLRTIGQKPEIVLGGLAALALAGVVVLAPFLVLGVVAAVILGVAVFVYPPTAAYVLIASTPLIVGVDRDALLPVLRPNEALILVTGGALLCHVLARPGGRARRRPAFTRIDLAILGLAVTGSLSPLLWMALRRTAISQDDVLYALTFWKYYALFVIVRTSVSTPAQVRRCLWLSLAAASLVAIIAVLQAMKLFGVPTLLEHFYAPFGNEWALEINRGTSTLASAVATGDVMAFNLAIALTWLAQGEQRRGLLVGASGLFVFGGLASGQFSGVIALVIVVVVLARVVKRLAPKLLAGLVPVSLVAGLALQPVIARRLSGVGSGRLPPSWLDRLHNLQTYFWPRLFSDLNFVFGVQPSARIANTHRRSGYIWIESGHTWLLWTGGVPLFAAFVWFLWRTMRLAARRTKEADVAGVVATATLAALWTVAILMLFDPHVALRGSADLLFSLLGLMMASIGYARALDSTERHERLVPEAAALAR